MVRDQQEAWTIEEWARGAKIAKSTYFTIQEASRPKCTRVGRRVVITESPGDWLRRMAKSGEDVTTTHSAAK